MADDTRQQQQEQQDDQVTVSSSPGQGQHRRAHFEQALSFTDLATANSTRSNSPEPLTTPTLAQSYGSFKKNLSFKSLRELEAKEIHKHVWRKGKRDDPHHRRHKPLDLDQLLAHAIRGGSRSFILGCSLRAGVNLLLALLRVTRKRRLQPALILHALFGADTLRFGGMLGAFSFLYKFVLHALRLGNPNGLEEYWHAALAGAVSGLSVWAEKPSRRTTIGQQLFVRGLQGNYNILKSKGIINIPHGDILLFGISCAQIMYCWLMAPDALPPGYRRFITGASRVAEPCLPVNLSTTRHGIFDPSEARKSLFWKGGATPQNTTIIEEYCRKGELGDFGPRFAPCAVVHPWTDTCSFTAVDRWQSVFRWMFPVYASLHIIPPILLRHKVFLKNPQRVLLKSALGTLRSCSFLATFVTLFQGLVCAQRNVYYAIHGRVPEWMEKIVLHRFFYWFNGFGTCLALFIEEKKRRGELAMYVLPRGLEALWSVLRKRSYVPFVPGGEILLTSVGMGMVMSTYTHEPAMLSGLVRSILYQIIGHG
ncbi:hypothetical protein T439DRAFT_324689 [Meredithblackwellia eburnea MCA 4105]